MFCTSCGYALNSSDRFCGRCGIEINNSKINTDIELHNKPNQSARYSSPFENEKIIRKFRGINPVLHFAGNQGVSFLQGIPIDVFITTMRICLLHGDENKRQPKKIGWLLPLGGAVGYGINILATTAINEIVERRFEKKIGGPPSSIEIDSMCGEGNAIFSIGTIFIEIHENKRTLFERVVTDPDGHIAFVTRFQTAEGVTSGGLILKFSGSGSEMEGLFSKIKDVSIKVFRTPPTPTDIADRFNRMASAVNSLKN